ncbi:MAG: 5'-nucleotidase [bacterium]
MAKFVTILLVFLAVSAFSANIGKANVDLDGSAVKVQETNLGNFVADALRDASGADVALIHATAFRENAKIPAGDIDDQQVRSLLTLATDKVILLKLSPRKLKEVMERAVGKYPGPNVSMLQISGMKVMFDQNLPARARILSITIGDTKVALDNDTAAYNVAMPASLAKGAVGYILDFDEKVTKSMVVKDTTMYDVIAQTLAKNTGGVSTAVEGRMSTLPPKK